MYFGSRRRAQGVIVPVEVWQKLLEHAEDEVDLALAIQRDGGSRSHVLGQAGLDQALARAAAAADDLPG